MSNSILSRTSLGDFIKLPREILVIILREFKHDHVTLSRLYSLCYLLNKIIFEISRYNMVRFSNPDVTEFELDEFDRIYKNYIRSFGYPLFIEIQPDQSLLREIKLNQSELIKFSPQSLAKTQPDILAMTRYNQRLLHDTSKLGCLILCPEEHPNEISTFLETYQFPNALVLILCNLDVPHDRMRSLSQENFKSLKHIVVLKRIALENSDGEDSEEENIEEVNRRGDFKSKHFRFPLPTRSNLLITPPSVSYVYFKLTCRLTYPSKKNPGKVRNGPR